MLQAIRNIGSEEPAVRVGQVVVDRIAFRNRTHRLEGVDVVVSGRNTEFRVKKTLGDKHQRRGHDELTGLRSNEQTTFVSPTSDLNDGGLKRSFVEIRRSQTVAVDAARNERMVRIAERHAVTTGHTGSESAVQDRSSLDLLRVRHSSGKALGVALAKRVVQIVLNSFFRDGETESNRLVVITSRPSFLRIIVRNGLTLGLNRGSGESAQLRLFFKRAVGGLSFVDLLVLFAILLVLQTEQGVQAGQQLLKKLCA